VLFGRASNLLALPITIIMRIFNSIQPLRSDAKEETLLSLLPKNHPALTETSNRVQFERIEDKRRGLLVGDKVLGLKTLTNPYVKSFGGLRRKNIDHADLKDGVLAVSTCGLEGSPDRKIHKHHVVKSKNPRFVSKADCSGMNCVSFALSDRLAILPTELIDPGPAKKFLNVFYHQLDCVRVDLESDLDPLQWMPKFIKNKDIVTMHPNGSSEFEHMGIIAWHKNEPWFVSKFGRISVFSTPSIVETCKDYARTRSYLTHYVLQIWRFGQPESEVEIEDNLPVKLHL